MHRLRAVRVALAMMLLLVGAACATSPAAAVIRAGEPSVHQAADRVEGKIVYVREGNVWVLKGGEASQLTSGGTWRQPALSPNGDELAYVYRDKDFSDLFAMASDGTGARQLTKGQAALVASNDWALRPAWSPDGSQLAYVSDAASYYPVLWMMNKDGSSRRSIMPPSLPLDSVDAISWAPDGRRIAFTGMGRDASQIYTMDLGRGLWERLTTRSGGALDPAWSPNGETIAYIGRENGRADLWLTGLDGGPEVRSDKLTYVRSPVWSPDGQRLAVLSAHSGAFEIWIAPVEGTGAELRLGDFRQVTRDGGIDAASGLSWAK